MTATLIILLCALACVVGMALMMLFMRKGHHASGGQRDEDEADGRPE
jgi:hypothetical protein